MLEKRAVYAGTFDPPTIGHEWMVLKGSEVFDHLFVAIGVNPDKKTFLSLDERLAILKDTFKHLPNVSVDQSELEYVVDYARKKSAKYLLRGLRNTIDLEYEYTFRQINEELAPEITTIFLMPPKNLSVLSSSFVKGLVGPTGWEKVVKRYLPDPAYRKILEKYSKM